ncbi:VOC family protein [Arthrobacter castelli]|uniref:VOC family protein n=1 Tax=Arthrobacter castelli TaxID=271431 RepID=UPI000402C00A|nr:VOC family protein [Arthrobacter castelli]
MQPNVDVLTLAVGDLDASRRFYIDGLKWVPTLDVPGEVIFIQIGHGLLLSLYDAEKFAVEADLEPSAVAPVSLGHNVDSIEEVEAVMEQAEAAGATIIAPARRMSWGGCSGYFADPDGFRWEIVFNPGLSVDQDGTVRIEVIDQADTADPAE